MATRTDNRERKSSNRSSNSRNGERSAFSFGSAGTSGGTAPLLGALAAGAAIGIGANWARKFLMQKSESISAGNEWDEILKLEHRATLAKFDMLLATDDSDTGKRASLVKTIHYALNKHAHQEEQVVYPALRQANETVDADHLEHEHGYVKTFLYELENMEKDAPEFLSRVREFRNLIEEHARMEEEQVFPRFKQAMSPEQDKKITMLMNKEGMKML
ncbi:hemerythrin domain-containing protein [Sphingomonas sp. BN140010]|uniref:Hemerythrin domain-containing protein n=1 Tax=Sphingomonas arvum TaxID=2992113 RepID=A0ABT3JEP0_9SPHN|nr:hemerythrin domain-containing protein [Sphingomonas sp. BN140010]MCW3797506.1 hemerythrin domain-containing protein [Sphingomonas sp. BN140010]